MMQRFFRSRPISELDGKTAIVLLLAVLTAACVSREERRAGPAERRGEFYTTEYLSKAEALRAVFPDAARVLRKRVALSPERRREVEKLVGAPLRQDAFVVYFGVRDDGELDGYAVVQEEIGKFKYITFIAGVEPSGAVRRVAVMVYREARGGEVAQRRFLVQYRGKSVREAFSINRDIINITGATMSVNAMNHGMKKVLAVIESTYLRDPEGLKEALRTADEETDFVSVSSRSSPGSRPQPFRDARLIMGSICEIEVRGESPSVSRLACRRAFDEMERIEGLLSDYRADSELSRVSKQAAGEPFGVSELTAQFLRHGRKISEASNGAFDLTIGPLVDAWGFRAGVGRIPGDDELAGLRPLVDYRKVLLRRDASGRWQVRLAEEGMRIDPGGLGKGFAVDRAVAVLRENGVRSAFVSFSSCSYALGTPPGESAWRVAVRDPRHPGRVAGTLRLADEAVASSGVYEKFVEIGGRRFGHILSPRSLRPVDGVLGAVVRAPSATLADGWSTAAMVLGAAAPGILKGSEEVSAWVVLSDGSPAASVSMSATIKSTSLQ